MNKYGFTDPEKLDPMAYGESGHLTIKIGDFMENNETVVIYSETSGYVCVSEESWRMIEDFQSGKFFCGKDIKSLEGMYQFNALLPGVKTKEGDRIKVRCVTFNESQEARYPHLRRFCRTEFIYHENAG